MHGVKYSRAYENENACRDFAFWGKYEKKLTVVNFFAVLHDGSTDKSVTEPEVVYVVFADRETANSCFLWSYCTIRKLRCIWT